VKLSFNWLSELVTLPRGTAARDVAERLSRSGLEVESITARGQDLSGIRVAEVLGARPHPGAEKLRIVRLTLGDGTEHEVVCGAPNVPGPGGLVAWAPPGATLPGGITLGRKEIRGFESPGMLCSARELGLGADADADAAGILVLTAADQPGSRLAAGADLVTALRLSDLVFEVNVTPNRADALSHAGIAREVGALYETAWRLPEPGVLHTSEGIETPFPVEIRDSVACPRYQATVVRGLRVAPAPLWMRLRLGACGVRSICNLVDVTNYVMLETGHPLHAFDLMRVSAPIVVRRALPGEILRTLDGAERALEGDDIVIADKHGPVALAGVMGGASSEVVATTTDVVLEAATFDARSVRRTARRLGLHSEASHRFERGVDPSTVARAGTRAAALLAEVGGGTVAPTATDLYPVPVRSRTVTLSLRRLQEVSGFEIPATQAIATLGGLGIVSSVADDGIAARVPPFRPDITIEEDLIEEVMRMIGLDRVPARLPAAGKAPGRHPERLAERARDALAALGLHEIVGWAFVARAALAALGQPELERGIAVKNPISSDYEVMRTSLLPGLAEAAKRNLSRGVRDVRLFEVGPVVRPLPEAPERHHEQRTVVAGLLVGREAGWLKPGEPTDFFDLAHVVVELLRRLGTPVSELRFLAGSGAGAEAATGAAPLTDAPEVPAAGPAPGAPRSEDAPAASAEDAGSGVPAVPVGHGIPRPALLHPGVSARVVRVGRGDGAVPVLGQLGQLHPVIARRLGLEVPAFYFELELERLEGHGGGEISATPVPRFPAASRDVSFWIDVEVSARAQEDAMRAAEEPLLREVAVLEDFRDPRFAPPGKKGMLWTLTYQADDRTLTDAEVDAAHARVVAALTGAHTVQIR
jgi:phenylalanyl-tRNA synthetase beta chain